MRWGRQQRQEHEQRSSSASAFSLFRVLAVSSWFSKLKPTRSKPEPSPFHTPAPVPVSRQRYAQVTPPKKARARVPEFPPRAPYPGLSPERLNLRPSSASDHLSFSPAVLDRLVDRTHEETSPRRHSCAGEDDPAFFVRSQRIGGRPFDSARFHGTWTEPGVPLLSCRSCRADPERPHGFYSRNLKVPSEAEVADSEGDDSGRDRRRARLEAATRRKQARGRRATSEEPSLPKESGSASSPTDEFDWRSSRRVEKSRRRHLPAPEPATGQDQRQRVVGSRRPFSFSGKMRQRSRVKVYSPRAAAAAARAGRERSAYPSKRKVASEEEEEEEKLRRGEDRKQKQGRSLESFAVVKCSTDPQGDFRESMVEMIRQKGIKRPEEMEGLLACYLALNADEYHDVIVKVFRQVWLDIRTARPPQPCL